MSDKPQKPADPDATVMMTPGALKGPDPDATVMMTPGALKGPDADATVMMPAGLGKEPPADAPRERVPMAAFQREDDPDATVIGAPPPEPEPEPEPVAAALEAASAAAGAAAAPARELSTPVSADTSRMPMIAGGVVVLAVALYFAFGGGKAPPSTPKPDAGTPAAATVPAPEAVPAPTASPAPVVAAPAAPGKPATSDAAAKGSLKDLLAGEAKGGLISVSQEGGATTIILRSTNQFASGGTDLDPKLHAAIAGIAKALDKVPGAIVVTGHADAKPSTNAKFPSNEALSAARGESVAKLLSGKLRDPKRVTSAGAGDTQQVAPSDTPENRAKNRRVVIVVRSAS